MIEEVDLTKVFYYDETSPSGLRWAVDIPYKGLFGGANMKRRVGDVAGTKQRSKEGDQYRWKVKYQQKAYMAHRIVYEIHYGKLDPKLVIDHRDGNSENNLISNLRLVTQPINTRNSKMRKNNKTGQNGVSLRIVNGFEYYAAGWVNLNGKQGNKYFSIKKLGHELAEFLACEYRLHMIDLLNRQGFGYTERHGKLDGD